MTAHFHPHGNLPHITGNKQCCKVIRPNIFCRISVIVRNKQLVDEISKGAICKNHPSVKYWLLSVADISRLAHLAVQLWTRCVGSV